MNADRIGYIYRIRGYGMDYYGSTIQVLNDRIYTHKSHYKRYKNGKGKDICSSFDILDKGDDWTFECLETLITDINKIGLLEREQYWINNYECVNKVQAVQTKDDLKEYKRKWAENKRRENGIPIREKIKTADEKKYNRDKARKYKENMSEEKRQELLKKRRERYDNDKQREYVNRPEVKEKRLVDQQHKRNIIKLFNILPFANQMLP